MKINTLHVVLFDRELALEMECHAVACNESGKITLVSGAFDAHHLRNIMGFGWGLEMEAPHEVIVVGCYEYGVHAIDGEAKGIFKRDDFEEYQGL